MGRTTKSKSTRSIIVAIGLLVAAVPLSARKLTTTQMRENTIRINALEIEEPGDNTVPAKKITCEDIMGPIQPIVFDEGALNFDFDKSYVKPYYNGLLGILKEFLNEKDYNVGITGHTDSKGSDAYNMALGMRRAKAVKDRLIELGLSSSRIRGIDSKGESEPIATNETDEGRAQNRRIEFDVRNRDGEKFDRAVTRICKDEDGNVVSPDPASGAEIQFDDQSEDQ
ncbi:OmpA family protein [Leptotrichia buccalis]|jgi:ompA/motB domain protein|uniref:OmpA/MotB domain protein n=1 Tax=Leptotrichia buccalis (strain ATCC 14201 / DSM 1135 / JCM 12969 / NCTC 10249 / C-1013-b) TaxID=523794 RepID=C7NB14_LEPBD|nr:OmpA family protein [Leptotrichia buccalis]ACV39345.1 OmpA/MotB domain protein [Leptotrichia buccalis C-1013-b]